MAKSIPINQHEPDSLSFETLTQYIATIHSSLQRQAFSAINRFATIRNWLIGHYIVEYEQSGNDRAIYGTKLLQKIAARLHIRGINPTLLANARNFYLYYPQVWEVITPIFPTASEKLEKSLCPIDFSLVEREKIFPTASEKFITQPSLLISALSFSHIVELLTISHPLIRFFY